MRKNNTYKFVFVALLVVGLSACAGNPPNERTVTYSTDSSSEMLMCEDPRSNSCVESQDRYYDDSRAGSETGRLIGAAILQGVVHGVIEVLVHALVHH